VSPARQSPIVDLARLGRGLRALRRRRGWRQVDLAAAAGVSRSQVCRIELGDSAAIPVGALGRVVASAGGTLDLLVLHQGEALDRLLDEAHARLVDLLVERLRALGWVVAVEVSFSRYGERGSIDVLAWHPVRRALAVFEVKSVTPDLQALLAGLDRKARLAPSIASERGWEPVAVARILVLGETSTNRDRLARHASTVDAALPAGTRDVRRWLAEPVAPGIAGVLFLRDVRPTGVAAGGRHRVRVRRRAPRTEEPRTDPG
jgi:transcriptional regulator with XRE-family HTH domain